MKASVSKISCTECRGRLQLKYIDQDFERGGSTVKLCGIRAWVCQNCGEVYFMRRCAEGRGSSGRPVQVTRSGEATRAKLAAQIS